MLQEAMQAHTQTWIIAMLNETVHEQAACEPVLHGVVLCGTVRHAYAVRCRPAALYKQGANERLGMADVCGHICGPIAPVTGVLPTGMVEACVKHAPSVQY
jgi:hypothetical protein